MSKSTFLKSSLKQLTDIAAKTHNKQILPIAINLWEKHLQPQNPLWKFVTARPFTIDGNDNSAHVLAMVDKRLPNVGLVGYFACSNSNAGAKVLEAAANWLKEKYGIKKVYGPINGTATSDYRLNLADDFWFPGEPINPNLHIEAFIDSGFTPFNRYVSGISKNYRLFIKLFVKKPKNYSQYGIRPFDPGSQLNDLRKYHNLMTTVFPEQSVYCPVLSWKERLYNMSAKEPIFDPRYTYFLEENKREVGIIVSYPYRDWLIVKTIALLPEYRGKNLSGLLIHRVHDQAYKDGLKAAIYAMIREGNTIYKMKGPGVRICRRYVTMCKTL